MSGWEHKERIFHNNEYYQSNQDEKMIRRGDSRFPGQWKNRNFTTWLDWQCKDGWELFKIFRDHNSGRNACIFRRLV